MMLVANGNDLTFRESTVCKHSNLVSDAIPWLGRCSLFQLGAQQYAHRVNAISLRFALNHEIVCELGSTQNG